MSILSDNLKKIRKKLGLNQESVAQYLNISRPAYSQYETGNRNPDWNTIVKLADFFQVSTDCLLGRTAQKPENTTGNESALTEDQQALLDLYQQFNETQRAKFIGYGERVLEETAESLSDSIYKKNRS